MATCTAAARIDNSWQNGYQAAVTVTNTGSAPVNPWRLTWTLPPGVTLGSGWNATLSQSGPTVTAAAPNWNQLLGVKASVTIGFTANGPASAPPTAITLNGASCG